MLARFSQNRGVALMGAHSIHFAGREPLAAAPKLRTSYGPPERPLVIDSPGDVPRYRRHDDLNMTHSGSCFWKTAWEAVGGYSVAKEDRMVPFSDRDVQLRVSTLWPVAVAHETPIAFWLNDASVDGGVNS
jgi:hypothetical protein